MGFYSQWPVKTFIRQHQPFSQLIYFTVKTFRSFLTRQWSVSAPKVPVSVYDLHCSPTQCSAKTQLREIVFSGLPAGYAAHPFFSTLLTLGLSQVSRKQSTGNKEVIPHGKACTDSLSGILPSAHIGDTVRNGPSCTASVVETEHALHEDPLEPFFFRSSYQEFPKLLKLNYDIWTEKHTILKRIAEWIITN